MSLLLKIQAATKNLPEAKVDVPQWGCSATLRRMCLAERSSMFERLSGDDNKINVATLLVAFSLVDEDGIKLHINSGVDEVYNTLEQGVHEVIELLYKEADKLSAVTSASVEEIEKN